jgi:Ca2+/Na+ antiporter
MLWAEGGAIGWIAFVLSAAAIVFTADIPLALLTHATRDLYSPTGSILAKLGVSVVARPAPLILLAIAIFYLFVFARRDRSAETLPASST